MAKGVGARKCMNSNVLSNDQDQLFMSSFPALYVILHPPSLPQLSHLASIASGNGLVVVPCPRTHRRRTCWWPTCRCATSPHSTCRPCPGASRRRTCWWRTCRRVTSVRRAGRALERVGVEPIDGSAQLQQVSIQSFGAPLSS